MLTAIPIVLVTIIFLISSITKITHFSDTSITFSRYALIDSYFAPILVIMTIAIEIILIVGVIITHTRISALYGSVVFIVIVTVFYAIDWTINMAPTDCGCGISLLGMSSTGISVITRNIMMLIIIYVGIYNTNGNTSKIITINNNLGAL